MNRARRATLLLVAGIVLPALLSGLAPLSSVPVAVGAPAAPPGFATSQFQQVWSRTDLPITQGAVSRSWIWGPQPGQTVNEPFAGASNGARTVQYFDKARMEANPSADPSSEWATTTGLLVVEMVSGKVQVGPNAYDNRTPADVPVVGDGNTAQLSTPAYASFRGVASLPGGPDRKAQQAIGASVTATIDHAGDVGTLQSTAVRNATYYQETGHNVPDVFDRFMKSTGLVIQGGALVQAAIIDPVYVLGYPISEAYWTTAQVAGKQMQVLVQLYQRRVLTYIPGYTAPWDVQMGNVGLQYYSWRYGTASQPQGSAQSAGSLATPTPGPGAGDTFVHVGGNKLFYNGSQVLLKGTNYWMQTYPFVGTWTTWNGNVVKQELDKARQLGVNSIRIGVPYDQVFALNTVWAPGCGPDQGECDHLSGRITNEMTQLLQVAAGYNMKIVFALFDWSDRWPAADSWEYARQVSYLKQIVGPFVNDDRVLAWDVHNEPENYTTWGEANGVDHIITWLANMSGVLHATDTRHPLTIGVGNYQTLWVRPRDKQIINMVDIVSIHCYDAGGLRTQIDAVTSQTNKPVLLEEMGWPSGPAELSTSIAQYDEATQQFLYKTMLGDAKASPLVGVVQWQLSDNPLGTKDHYIKPTVESWFGLVRRDGSFKPAAADFQQRYVVPSLPSTTVTNLPLTTAQQLATP